MNKNIFHDLVKPYSMTSTDRIYTLYDCMEYIRLNNIKGDFVECGVWRGGNILGIIEYLNFHKMDGNVWLFDTFSGMTAPEEVDIDHNNRKASSIFHEVRCENNLGEVKSVLSKSQFPQNRIKYIIGDVEKTLSLPEIPNSISLLRLDTDWYASTKKELEVLYPVLNLNGVLIVDDYGHWQGAKKAVDEYFSGTDINIEKIDYTGIKIIKK